MLINFTVENYLSFLSPVSFSMIPAENIVYKENNIALLPADFPIGKLLKSAVIYGANGAGKSNLIDAMSLVREAVLHSFSEQDLIKKISDNHFKLEASATKKPSVFEIVFLFSTTQYRYGFSVHKGVVVSEWLFKKSSGATRESYCFKREFQQITINPRSFKGAKGVPAKTKSTSLFISSCASFNVLEAINVKDWFHYCLMIPGRLYSGTPIPSDLAETYQWDTDLQKLVTNFMKLIDLGIRDIQMYEEEYDLKKMPEELIKFQNAASEVIKKLTGESVDMGKRLVISTTHDKYRGSRHVGRVEMPFELESEGSQLAFLLAMYLFHVILARRRVLVLDEFGANLHTKLSYEFINLFHGTSNKDSQLIVATHDTNLLRKDLFRRDQIWFAEKDKQRSTDLYSLVEFKMDKDSSFERDYLQGKYGAIPYFGDIERLIREYSKNE